jgi:hypothetical protein
MDVAVSLLALGAACAFTLAFGGACAWPAWLRRGGYALAVAAALLAAARFALTVWGWLPAAATANSADFLIFYHAGQAARRWQPLYYLAGLRQDSGAVVFFRHAPVGALLFVPWTWLPYHAALNAWRLLNVGIYVLTLLAVLRLLRIGWRTPLALGLVALWLVSAPSRDSLALGQWDALFLALVTGALALYWRRRDRDLLAGALLALPVARKIYPALLLLAPLLARRWRVLAGCVGAGVALLALGALGAGPANTGVFLFHVLPALGGGTLYAENQTLYAFVGRLLATQLVAKGVNAHYPVLATRIIAGALGLVILAVTALVCWRCRQRGLGGALCFVLPMPAALLIVPTAWAHYATWTLLPLAVLAAALARERLGWPTIVLFALAALLVPFGSERDVWRTAGAHDGAIRLVLTYKAYGLLALWAGCTLAAWRLRHLPAARTAAEREHATALFVGDRG